MNWNDLGDRIFGFLPHRSIFWFAISTSFTIILTQFVIRKVENLVKPPWAKEENLRQRHILLQTHNKSDKKGENAD